MRKIFFAIVLACGLALFSGCESALPQYEISTASNKDNYSAVDVKEEFYGYHLLGSEEYFGLTNGRVEKAEEKYVASLITDVKKLIQQRFEISYLKTRDFNLFYDKLYKEDGCPNIDEFLEGIEKTKGILRPTEVQIMPSDFVCSYENRNQLVIYADVLLNFSSYNISFLSDYPYIQAGDNYVVLYLLFTKANDIYELTGWQEIYYIDQNSLYFYKVK